MIHCDVWKYVWIDVVWCCSLNLFHTVDGFDDGLDAVFDDGFDDVDFIVQKKKKNYMLWMEEFLHQLPDGLSNYNPIIYSVSQESH